ncbi:MAG: primosomal protein N' [Phycisphaerales bacterium]|nr:primosomal protein N' [Phycisphaerales bacterium]
MSLFPSHDDLSDAIGEDFSSFVQVAVERGVDRADGLTYAAPEDVGVGQRVMVPVGRGNTPTAGIVIRAGGRELLGGFDPRKIKRILSSTDARVNRSVIELARWMSGYYLAPIGMVLATALPGAVKAKTGSRTRTAVRPTGAEICADELRSVLVGKTKEAWAAIGELSAEVWPIDAKVLRARLGLNNVGPINRLVAAGLMEEVEVRSIRAPEAFDLLEARLDTRPRLTDQQREVVEGIGGALDTFGVHLVQGVTGSGKTEVYMHLIERVLASGRSALVLVPEISLTPQTGGRFVSRFRDAGVAVLHSGLTASTRHKQWAAAQSGEARVVVGARSAVFAPLENIGIIVVDEEHDGSYKQDSMPRYNGRDAAIKRGQIEGCPVVLGSATPSLESYANAKSGRFSYWKLTTRAHGGAMPEVKIVDMERDPRVRLDERAEGLRKPTDSIGPTLHHELVRTINDGSQAILLLNRRGFASVVVSSDAKCGWRLECDQCDSTMVVHRGSVRTQGGRRFVRCHHCGSEQLIPKSCPMTGKPVVELGAGTQRVEDEIERRYGELLGLKQGETFVRVDSDSMKNAKDYFDILERFGRGELRVLLGTQMIAKGLDFPNVSLVGVLSADTALYLPDFRAEERTFQLVNQVAGRAGRGEQPGRVVVQTVNALSPAITLAAAHRYEAFASEELNNRRMAGFPPATRMARVVVRHEDSMKAKAIAAGIAGSVRTHAGNTVQVTGPMECAIARISNQYRWSVEFVAEQANLIQRALGAARADGVLKSDATTAVDVDPLWLM